MKITNARYVSNQGYPQLEVDLDGTALIIDAEQKPTLVRHGLVSVPSSGFVADLNGRQMQDVTDDPRLFRLAIAFGLDCYYRRFKEGPAHDNIDSQELQELGERLKPYASPGSPSWTEIVALFLPIRALAS